VKVSLSWIKDYLDLTLTPRELAEKLTMAGLEVNAIETIGGTWDNIVVGQIETIDPHPNADRLRLVTVNTGKDSITVVCGAPNIMPSQKVAFASLGARLRDGHTGKSEILKTAKIRGVVSTGMICSEMELGISDDHEGILVMSPEAPVGMSLEEYLGDTILNLEITPNRPDCMSIIGIAREIAALTGEELHLSETPYEESGTTIDSQVSVDIAEPDLCPRYCASLVRGVKSAPSPDWLQQRLRNCGMRPISNIVDITNYVMLEYGQPLHSFDYHKLSKGKDTSPTQVIVRCARKGESMTSLDEVERTLNASTLVIADREKPVAIAGIMGGRDAEVTGETSAILLESANFERIAIRRASSDFQLRSEASIRFDKGLNPGLTMPALKRATQLMLELAGGEATRGTIDVYPARAKAEPIIFPTSQVERLTGMKISHDQITQTLTSLGFDCEETSPSQVSVSVPYWRSDIKSSADLVEEVTRIVGYDKVPLTRLSSPLPPEQAASGRDFIHKIRSSLVGFGLQEILSYSLVSLENLQHLFPSRELKVLPVKVANPMTREQEYLRTSLRAGLLSTLSRNQRHGSGGLELFEIGKVFMPQEDDLPREEEQLCIILSGSEGEPSWHGNNKPVDFFHAKGIVEALANQMEIKVQFEPCDDEGLVQRVSANVSDENGKLGVIGLLHPRVTEAFELSCEAYLIEIDLERARRNAGRPKAYQTISRFPIVPRDIALIVNEETTYQQITDIVQNFPLVKETVLFDLYRGEQIPQGKKSFALRITYQSPGRTLTDEEVEQVQKQMLDKLNQKLSAILRS